MKAYVAARIEDRTHAEEIQRQLNEAGIETTSRWMRMEAEKPIENYDDDVSEAQRRGEIDLDDVNAADILVIWKPRDAHRDTTGGHHVETGVSISQGKPIFLIGERENIFHWHKSVRLCDTIEDAVHKILALEPKDFPLSTHSVDSFQRWTRQTAIYVDAGRRTTRSAVYCAIGGGGEAGEIVEKILGHVRAESDRLLSRNDLTDEEAKAVENLGVVIGALHNFAYTAKRLEELKRPIRDGSMPLPEMAPFPSDLLAALFLELGDSVWYFPSRLGDELGFRASEVLAANVKKLLSRKERGTLHGTGDNR